MFDASNVSKKRWLVTGAAGFIGSNLVETLLKGGASVVGLDNFSTGHRRNLTDVEKMVGINAWKSFRFIEGDIQNPQDCRDALESVDIVLHQAALGSVPRSIERPVDSFNSNVAGFFVLLDEVRKSKARRFVYASSSSVYGDDTGLPKMEDKVGRPLSPYAATKAADELFADTFSRTYNLECVGLRYFNVFGPRQDPNGPYAAVIPRWIKMLVDGEPVWINGDGQTSRDFCYIANTVQANLLAGLAASLPLPHSVYNVAVGQRATLLELFDLIKKELVANGVKCAGTKALHRDFRAGDVKHSLADISKIVRTFGYAPTDKLADDIARTVSWHVQRVQAAG